MSTGYRDKPGMATRTSPVWQRGQARHGNEDKPGMATRSSPVWQPPFLRKQESSKTRRRRSLPRHSGGLQHREINHVILRRRQVRFNRCPLVGQVHQHGIVPADVFHEFDRFLPPGMTVFCLRVPFELAQQRQGHFNGSPGIRVATVFLGEHPGVFEMTVADVIGGQANQVRSGSAIRSGILSIRVVRYLAPAVDAQHRVKAIGDTDLPAPFVSSASSARVRRWASAPNFSNGIPGS